MKEGKVTKFVSLVLLALSQHIAQGQVASNVPNVLFISIDDLRPELGVYGSRARTPHIDGLASRGLTFDRAFCNSPMCNPSRASLLTGLRPDTIRVWDNCTPLRAHAKDVVTLPEYFKRNGYFTQGIGKVFSQNLNDPQSWSVPHRPPAYDFFVGPSWQVSREPEGSLPDAQTADRVIQALTDIKAQGRTFFLAAGFIRPHLPFVAPHAYFEPYPLDDIHLPENRFPPQDVPPIALHDLPELGRYPDIPNRGPLSDGHAKNLIRAYLAAVSFVDAQVGRVLAQLDNLELRGSTIVVLWGDHGWHLGENSLWSKFSNFEVAARVPLIISVPGQTDTGMRTEALVELVDLYPTLCELAGLTIPDGLEGRSLAPLLKDLTRPWKTAVFYQFFRPVPPFCFLPIEIMGYSMATERYRYTEWVHTRTKEVVALELYDHESDPGESVNIAGRAENAALQSDLSDRLAAGWKGALGSIPSLRRGDANADGTLDVSDVTTTLTVLFLGESDVPCGDAADSNDDGALNIADALFTVGHLFFGNVGIPDPGPDSCGVDPSDDGLGCDSFPPCW